MRSGLAALLGVGVLAAVPPALGFHPYYLFLLSTAFLLAAVASAWNLLAYAGPISFGHAAFFGLGAYGAALASLVAYTVYGCVALVVLARVSRLSVRELVVPTRADLAAYPAALRKLLRRPAPPSRY